MCLLGLHKKVNVSTIVHSTNGEVRGFQIPFFREWLSEGIESEEIERTGFRYYSYQVTCKSSHLTAFAVLVDIVEVSTHGLSISCDQALLLLAN